MVFRLCGPATHALPPFCDIPIELRDTLRGQYELLNGKDVFPVAYGRLCRSLDDASADKEWPQVGMSLMEGQRLVR